MKLRGSLHQRLRSSICHSRAGGNPGLFSAELAWIPAFAGMTESRRFFVSQNVSPQVFSKDDSKFHEAFISIRSSTEDKILALSPSDGSCLDSFAGVGRHP